MESVRVVESFSEELLLIKGAETISLDCEGVDLGREGLISIVQVAIPGHCFLVDVLGKDRDDPLIAWLRKLLEDAGVLKVIHDCRVDSDALFHHFGIMLVNVHDTSCWHKAITGCEAVNLNDTLSHNGIRPNCTRDGSVYKVNHAFWTTRPLTKSMVEWAAGDVQCMFQLHAQQIKNASGYAQQRAMEASDDFLNRARSANIATVRVRNPGLFIGRGGSNLHRLQRETGVLIYGRGKRSENNFVVYYHTEEALATVKRAANR